jgi:hypothetical protein
MPPRSRLVWGDGFVDDCLSDLSRVVDWCDVSIDEYSVLFPRLSSRDGTFPPLLLACLETCLTVRRWRIAAFDDPRGAIRSDRVATLHRDWFADDDMRTFLLRRVGLLKTPPSAVVFERRVLRIVEGALIALRRGAGPTWSADAEAWFAFASGIHPAYLWPESLPSAERGYTAAWLGHLDRGRPALMPAAVADHLQDSVVGRSGPQDAALAELAGRVMQPSDLRRAAERRVAGGRVVVSAGRRPSVPAACGAASAPIAPPEKVSLERA